MSEVNDTEMSARRFFLQATQVETDCALYETGLPFLTGTLIGLIGADVRLIQDLPPRQR